MLYLLGSAMFLTVASLVFGLLSLFKGGAFNEKYGNKAMQLRITFQALALLIFGFILFLGK